MNEMNADMNNEEQVVPETSADVAAEAQEASEASATEEAVIDESGDQTGIESPNRMAVVEGGASAKTARFSPLGAGATSGSQRSMDLLLDVDLNLSVELGRTSIPVRDILQLGPGSIVELEKLSGEPVDIMVNGRLIAKGEVVVIDESFGVRVTEITSPSERLNKLATG